MESWHELSVEDLRVALSSGACSARELVDAHIERIDQVNPAVQGLVAERFDRARDEADAADTRRARSKRKSSLPPLLGVPCTVKEFIAVAGMPHTAGLTVRASVRATEDAPVVARLKAAGAVVMGVSNGPEGGLWHESNNLVHGRTSNPHDLYRSAGGSSGGEGALVASGASPFGIGSDVGGSIRLPAAFCGVVGHKPTHRRVPTAGHHPPGPLGEASYLAVGPLARSAGDLPLLLSVLEGPCPEDPVVVSWPKGEVSAWRPDRIRVGVLLGNGEASVRAPVAAGVVDAAERLTALGARLEHPTFPGLNKSFQIWADRLSALGTGYDSIVTGGGRVRLREQLPRWARGEADHTGAVLTMILLDRALQRLPSRSAGLVAALGELRRSLDAWFGGDGVLLMPVFARQAPLHRMIGVGNPADVGLTAIFNILELPATSVPMGCTPDGLPLAVQVVAQRGQDALCIAVAQWLEASVGRFRAVDPKFGAKPPRWKRLWQHPLEAELLSGAQ